MEGREAGKLLKEKGFDHFDLGYTSVLKRAILTYNQIVDELDLNHIPVHKYWRLNERHYGSLQGLNKAETQKIHGEEQVLKWRRSFDIPPPDCDLESEHHPKNDIHQRYSHLPNEVLPRAEV